MISFISLLMYEMGPFIVAKKAFCNRAAARCLASGAYLASFYHVFLLKNAWKMNFLFCSISKQGFKRAVD